MRGMEEQAVAGFTARFPGKPISIADLIGRASSAKPDEY
jgi:hypothetical protein